MEDNKPKFETKYYGGEIDSRIEGIKNQVRKEARIAEAERMINTLTEIFSELEQNCSYTGDAGHPIVSLDSNWYQNFKAKYIGISLKNKEE